MNHDLTFLERSNSIRRAEGHCDAIYARPKMLAGLLVGWCIVGCPLLTFAEDGPQELPKPSHMTVAPLFQEWKFDQSRLAQVPEGFTQGTGGQGGKAVGS